MSSLSRNDSCPCGSGKKYKKCCLGKTAAPHPAAGSTGHSLNTTNAAPSSRGLMEAVALHQAGRLAEAEAAYRALLLSNSRDSNALHYLGLIAYQRQQYRDAIRLIEEAVRINPGVPAFHCNLGNACKEAGLLDDAVAALLEAVRLDPGFYIAHINLGNVYQERRQMAEAVSCYRRALALRPDFAEAHSSLAAALRDQGLLEEAAASYRTALALRPDLAEAHNNLGLVLRELGRLDEARTCYRKAHELGLNGARVREALMLPAIMGTSEEVLASRAEFEKNLDQLLHEQVKVNDPLKEVGAANFYLAYHGLNDRDLQVKMAEFYAQACPSLLYTAPHCMRNGATRHGRIRVGFFSQFLYNHSVSVCYSKIVELLSQTEQFEVALISSRPADTLVYSGFTGQHVHLPYNLVQAREMVAALELDVLIYLDIGMEPLSYFLAFARLARVQCVLPGHPVTTGIANVDYFLSNEQMEPENAEAHYSEKLIRLPCPLFYFRRPQLPVSPKTRRELGLPDDRRIYMCPMAMQKLHPDFDEALARILQLDPEGVVVLFEPGNAAYWKNALNRRFERTIPHNLHERILFLPWISNQPDFISAITAADVILDPFHFGTGSTTAITSATGTPLVTKTGQFMRGRVGTAFCSMLHTMECVTDSTEAYAQQAVTIANDHLLRDRIRSSILEHSGKLYENTQPLQHLADFLSSITGRGETA